jgi:hypothetical protein
MNENLRGAAEQPRHDVGAGRGIRGCRERHRLDRSKLFVQSRQGEIFGAEIMAPLRNAMGLVNREEAELRGLEERDGFGLGETLRRDIDEAQLAALYLLDGVAIRAEIIGGIERRRGDPVTLELRHLVAHQRDQRRHHDRQPVAHQRRQLIAQRLAAAGRHDGEHFAAGKDLLDDLGLAFPERGESKHRAQQIGGVGEVGHGGISLRCREISRELKNCHFGAGDLAQMALFRRNESMGPLAGRDESAWQDGEHSEPSIEIGFSLSQ